MYIEVFVNKTVIAPIVKEKRRGYEKKKGDKSIVYEEKLLE